MKNLFYLCFFTFFSLTTLAQTIHEDFRDGELYVKIKQSAIKPLLGLNARAIEPEKIAFLSTIVKTYSVTHVMRPFAQADDDAVLPNVLKIRFTKLTETDKLIKQLQQLPEVDYCEPVPLMKTDVVPNEGMSTHLTQINAANAWNLFNGNSNITVAIVDNAVMWTHADLVQNTYTNTAEIAGNNIDDDNNGYVDDVNGWDCSNWDNNTIPTNTAMSHGTHCAGIAAATTNNGIGIAAIGWNLKMIPVKTEFDNGSPTSISNGYDGIIYAAKTKAKIISCSWGGAGFSSTEQAIVNYAWNKGCIIVASAGNLNSSTPNYPGAYANVYCVSSVDPTDVKSSFSNFGTWVDIAAPGNNINSTVPYTGTVAAYQSLSGTSMATPMVAGLAGMMLSLSPAMTRTNVLNCISTTAVNIYSISGNSGYSTGSQLGAGRIDAYQAMLCASSFSAMPPVANFFAFPKNTCPSTPVQFTDSSIYQPTTWSWTFQGGTPASSTSSAPVVSWSSPGTYSVAMTCSNVNGSSSITKLSYVTVSNPINLPFSEGFENSTFLPANWTEKNIDNDNIFWQRKTNLGGFGTSTACAMFDNYNYNVAGERDEMRSPKFDFSTVSTAKLRFDVAYAKYDNTYSDSLEVKLTNNCGQTWSTIYLKGGATFTTAADVTSQFLPSSSQWRKDSIDISAFVAGESNVMFSFVNHGHYGQAIYLDNINLFFPTPTVSATAPTTVCVNSPVSFSNTSLGAGGYTWTSTGASPGLSTGTNVALTFSTGGVKSVSLTAQNGTSYTTTVKTVTVINYPIVVAPTVSVCSGQSVTISASGASTYVWSDGTLTIGSGSATTVSPSATKLYTVTGYNSTCATSTIAQVDVIATPTVSAVSQSICPGESATLIATGANSYLWSTGATIAQISVSPSITTVYTFTGNSLGCDDIKTATVTVYPSPSITAISNPTIMCTGSTATFVASGASSYTWNGAATGSSFTLSSNTSTMVTITGFDGNCYGSGTASVMVIAPPSLSVAASPAPTLCAGKSVTLTASGANSYSWSAGGASTNSVALTPGLSANYTVTGSNIACSSDATIAIGVVALPQLAVAFSSPSLCAGQTISATASGATTYTWSNGVTTASATLSPTVSTNFTVIGSSNACSVSAVFTTTVYSLPQSILSLSNIKCNAACNGSYTLTTLGNGPFSYSSNTSCNTPTCVNLCAGFYTTTVTDVNGCQETKSFTLTEPPALTATITSINPSCGSCNTGSMSVQAGGGSPGYSYSWTPNGGSGPEAAFLSNGCYTVIITDANQCTYQSSKCIENTTGITEQIISGFKLYPNPASGEVSVDTEQPIVIMLYSSLGQLILEEHVPTGKSTINLSHLAVGVYTVQVWDGSRYQVVKLILD